MKPLEHHKNAVTVFRFDANAVVCHGEYPLATSTPGCDADSRCDTRTCDFDAVSNQVLKKLQ